MKQTTPISSEWRQTEEEVFIELAVGEVVQSDEVSLHVKGKDCICTFKDGREWSCRLWDDVVQSSANVTLKDGAIVIHLQKKEKFKEWAALEELHENRPPEASQSSDVGAVEGGGDSEILEAEEDLYMLNHVKHDFFPKQDLKVLYLHIYVKKIQKDSVKVAFSEDEICVKFKTNDNQFLQLNQNSTPDTLFCWKIRTWKPIDPAACSHKVAKSNLEIHIYKQKAEKWQTLERTSHDASAAQKPRSASQGDWVPLSGSQSAPYREQGEITKDKGSEKDALRGAVGGAKSVEIKDGMSARPKKPTCTVPPLSLGKQAQQPPSLPTAPDPYIGLCGLDNLGNTCFMNSVIQVLVNTRELKDYMLRPDIRNEINHDNPLGSHGQLVLAFAVLMRRLWGGQHKSLAPSKLKSIISSKASQFMGFAQHDAQEFMAFLLDGLHEDINRILKKPYTETVDSDGRADQVVADEAWKTHKKRNDSFIVDLFQGQYKSKLVCPECNKVSITFDPFMHLSVPLPKKKRYYPIFFFSRDCHQRPVKIVVSLSSDATVHELTIQVALKMNVQAANLRVYEIHRSCIHKVFSRKSTLTNVSPNDIIFVQEVLSPAMAGENVVEITVIQRMLVPPPLLRCSHCKRSCEKGRSLKRCTKCYRAAYCDQACQKNNWNLHRQSCKRVPEAVGCPFIISLPKSHATYARLSQLMESYARYSTNIFVPPLKSPASHASPVHAPNDAESTSSLSASLDSGFSSESHSRDSEHGDTEPSSETTLPNSSDVNSETTAAASLSGFPGSSDSMSTKSTLSSDSTIPASLGSSRGDQEQQGQGGGDANICERVGEEERSKRNNEDIMQGSYNENIIQGSREDRRHDDGRSFSRDENDASETRDDVDGQSSVGRNVDGSNTATVVGHPQMQERKMPLFFMKPATHMGSSMHNRERLSDQGDEPLDLSGITCLAMDWRNDPRQENCVLVESKNLDHTEDDSCSARSYEDAKLSLDQCLKLFTEPEKLSPEEAWYCPKCKQHREATKQMLLWRLPSTLIIQLKRFSFGNMLWRDKIDKMVDYPVRGLDFSPYCHGNHHDSPLIYDLYGVINHHGGILGGHYTSFARLVSTGDWSKNEHEWRLFDDTNVSPVSEKNVVTRSAYLLFYRRRQPYTPYIPRAPIEPEADASPDQEEMDDKSSNSSSSEMEVGDGDTNKKSDAHIKVNIAHESTSSDAHHGMDNRLSSGYAEIPSTSTYSVPTTNAHPGQTGYPNTNRDQSGYSSSGWQTGGTTEPSSGNEGLDGEKVGKEEEEEVENIGYTDMEDID